MTNLAEVKEISREELSECTETLKTIWDGTYGWIGVFTRGVDNRIVFARIVDRIITTKLTMGERYSTIQDLVGYYRYITDAEPERAQMDRLYAWARGNYDPRNYPHYTEAELQRRSRKFEKPMNERDELPKRLQVQGRRRTGMVVFSDDASFKLKPWPTN